MTSSKHNKKIILIGPKHSGKSSTGKALALLGSFDFFDTDELILQRTGKTPRQLYSENPLSFQAAEAETVKYLLETNSDICVIAAGGGVIDNSEAIETIKKSNVLKVYLNISVNNAWNRIINSANGELPPFLETENPEKTHRILHERRAAAYSTIADIIIEIEGKTPKEIAAEILNYGLGFS
jgi:shikimate kinase